MQISRPHKFHIPVMGLAYTIDSPIKVARFGISSVISIVESRLIEMMRKHYYPTTGKKYFPITMQEDDFRAKRITDYLNLINTIVNEQIENLKKAAFEKGSEIVKYFEMLPEDSKLKQVYIKMTRTQDGHMKKEIEEFLRTQISAGSIDVNIMTKVDRENYDKEGLLIEDGSEAVAALRGFSKSDLKNVSVVFSAGMNPRLYNYLGNCEEFDMDESGNFSKKVIVKVSDYRSALIQGKYLAKKGIWVSEFRIESGLNCGGHAFATDGFLLGPILEEFKIKRQELLDSLFEIYNDAIVKKGKQHVSAPPEILFSVQGGIGTHDEAQLMHSHYQINSTGWGTPFLLVPEATTVDENTMKLLSDAKEKDIFLSNNSPLGIRFHYLKGTSSDMEKLDRIKKGKPGSPCTEKHLAFNTEFTKERICTASKKYQEYKIAQLQSLNLPEQELHVQVAEVLKKECLCIGLSNSAAINYSETFVKKTEAVTICPGPNIVNFSKVVSLKTMVDHIYGRADIITSVNRPHMFIAELHLYIDYLKEKLIADYNKGELMKMKKYYASFCKNIHEGISYYRAIACKISDSVEQYVGQLNSAQIELDFLSYRYEISEG